jgi:hypothetical protein
MSSSSTLSVSSAGIVANMTASTVAQYLAALPADRRAARQVFPAALAHLSVSEFQFSAFSLSVRGEEGEMKEVTLATAFGEK